MIGGGIFNQPIMGNLIANMIKIISRFCLSGIIEVKYFINGLIKKDFNLDGLYENKIKITAKVKQRCNDDC